MKKVNRFLLLTAIFALTGSMAMAQIPTSILGEYVGTLHVTNTLLGIDETFYDVTMEVKESSPNYAIKVAAMNIGGIDLPEYEMDNVVITQQGSGYKLSRSGALHIVIDELEIPGFGTLTDVPIDITLANGYIEDNALTLNLEATATIIPVILVVTINIDFDGTLPAPPSCDPVTNATAQITNCETATITWDAMDGATAYEIERDGAVLGTVTTTTFTETDEFEHGKTYTWKIKTICDQNEAPQESATATADCETPPPPPCNPATYLTVIITTDPCSALLTWNAAPDMPDAKYNVYRNGELIKGDVEGTQYVDDDIEAYVEYMWIVKTICIDGEAFGTDWTGSCYGEQNINEPTNTITIYPNPSNTSVTITAKDFVKVEIYNTVGQLVETKTINVVDVSSYNTGVYLFKVYDANGNSVAQRVMVTR